LSATVGRQFKKGQSGNPKGRPKGSRNKISYRLAMDELVRIMNSKRSPADVKLRAANAILNMTMIAAGLR